MNKSDLKREEDAFNQRIDSLKEDILKVSKQIPKNERGAFLERVSKIVNKVRKEAQKNIPEVLVENSNVTEEIEKSPNVELIKKLLTPFKEVGSPVKLERCLREAGYKYIFDLILLGEKGISKVPGLGFKSVNAAADLLSEIGLSFETDIDDETKTLLQKAKKSRIYYHSKSWKKFID